MVYFITSLVLFTCGDNFVEEVEKYYKDGNLNIPEVVGYYKIIDDNYELVKRIEYYRYNRQSRYKGLKNGRKWTLYYVKREENYKDGKKDGKWTLYYGNGHIKEETNYKNGKIEGQFVSYYKNGQIKEEGVYYGEHVWSFSLGSPQHLPISLINKIPTGLEPSKIGEWNKYYENGQKMWEGIYDEYGKLRKEGNYKNDTIKHGKFISYNQYGHKEIVEEYKDGEKYGLWEQYNEIGELLNQVSYYGYKQSEKNYKNGILNNIVWYYENGQKMWEGNNKDRKKYGERVYYHEDGKIDKVEYYNNGHLSTKEDYIDGNIQNRSVTGYLVNKWTPSYYNRKTRKPQKDRRKTYEKNYKNGLPDKLIKYYSKGDWNRMEREENYQNGVKNGQWTYYNEDGKTIIKQEVYKDGQLIETIKP